MEIARWRSQGGGSEVKTYVLGEPANSMASLLLCGMLGYLTCHKSQQPVHIDKTPCVLKMFHTST